MLWVGCVEDSTVSGKWAVCLLWVFLQEEAPSNLGKRRSLLAIYAPYKVRVLSETRNCCLADPTGLALIDVNARARQFK